MSPSRKREVNGHVVEEYYWAGDYVVYVDNNLVKDGRSFSKVVDDLETEHES